MSCSSPAIAKRDESARDTTLETEQPEETQHSRKRNAGGEAIQETQYERAAIREETQYTRSRNTRGDATERETQYSRCTTVRSAMREETPYTSRGNAGGG